MTQDATEARDDDDCRLCLGCGEVEATNRSTGVGETVPCPECIAREIAEEREANLAQVRQLTEQIRQLTEENARLRDALGKIAAAIGENGSWSEYDDISPTLADLGLLIKRQESDMVTYALATSQEKGK